MLEEETVGFACTFLNHDSQYGALVDNLHVLKKYQGLGLGRKLMSLSAEWVRMHDPTSDIYLLCSNKIRRPGPSIKS